MVYRVLSTTELERQKDLSKAIRSIKKLQKYGMARRKNAASYQFSKKMFEQNYHNQLAINAALMEKIGNHYAWLRQKIQDPATPASEKRAYRKMEKILESEFGIQAMVENSPFFRDSKQAKPPKEAYAFCYVRARV